MFNLIYYFNYYYFREMVVKKLEKKELFISTFFLVSLRLCQYFLQTSIMEQQLVVQTPYMKQNVSNMYWIYCLGYLDTCIFFRKQEKGCELSIKNIHTG
jgi:hypothetical protein